MTDPLPAARRMQGIWLPLITSFNNGELDECSIKKMIGHYAGNGVDGFILTATTGESISLDDSETRRVVETAHKANVSGRPVFLGLTGSNTKKLVAKIRETSVWPINGYLIAAPYYVRPSQEGIFQHFKALAEAAHHPVVVYNIPYRTGVNVLNETMFRLAELPGIIGVKDCCANPEQSAELIKHRPNHFSVLVGDDATFFRNVGLGADGGILASAHVGLDVFQQTLALLRQDRSEEARPAWERFTETIALLFAEPNPGPVKYWLWRQGLITSPELRLPMTGITEDLQKRLDEVFRHHS